MLIERIPGQKVEGHKPAPRVIVSPETWRMLTGELAAGRMTLFGLWGDADKVHMALLQEAEIVVVTIECQDGKFPSVDRCIRPRSASNAQSTTSAGQNRPSFKTSGLGSIMAAGG